LRGKADSETKNEKKNQTGGVQLRRLRSMGRAAIR